MNNCCNCIWWRGIYSDEYDKCDNKKQRLMMITPIVRFDFNCGEFEKGNAIPISKWEEQFES